MKKDLLFLDQDETLVLNGIIIPGVSEFLEKQSEERDCIIATSSNDQDKKHLGDATRYLSGYFGNELLSIEKGGKTGELTRRHESVPASYKNPHLPNGYNSPKDLYLIKRLHAPCSYQHMRSVMIGNLGDLSAVAADPSTPLIMVDPTWAERKRTKLLLHNFFQAKYTPEQFFDHLFQEGEKHTTPESLRYEVDESVQIRLENQIFLLARNNQFKVRTIIENPSIQ